MRLFTLGVIALLALPAAGCIPGKTKVSISPRVEAPSLPPFPARLRVCLAEKAKIPVKDMTDEELVRLLAQVRTSEVRKSRCGRDAEAWYEGVRKNFGPSPVQKAKRWFNFGRN